MSLLPSKGPDASAVQEGEVEVVGVDEDVGQLLDALASRTARDVLNAIYDEPGTPSEIADRLDMSIQKVSYHLDKLEAQDLIAVAGTRYSEKGQEMKVYEPPDDPLVLFVGTKERKQSLRTLVKRLLPAVGVLGAGSLLVERFLADGPGSTAVELQGTSSRADSAGEAATPANGTADAPGFGADAMAQTPTPDPNAVETAGQIVSPGFAFFLGGLLVLALVVGWWAYRTYGQNRI